jgi:hypothetical protein
LMDDNWEKELDFHYFFSWPTCYKVQGVLGVDMNSKSRLQSCFWKNCKNDGWKRELKQISVHNSGFLAPRYLMIYSQSSTLSPSVPWMWMANLTLLLLSIMIELIW